jgi:hypothetical protein
VSNETKYEGSTVPELRAKAKAAGLKGYSKLNRAALLAALLAVEPVAGRRSLADGLPAGLAAVGRLSPRRAWRGCYTPRKAPRKAPRRKPRRSPAQLKRVQRRRAAKAARRTTRQRP